VEDERDLAHALRRALEEEQFAVDLAADGEDGLYKMREMTYDAVILDLMLPRVDGWSVLRAARSAGIRTPVLILTARDTIEDRVRGLNLGADDYLVKPFALAELIARVRAMIRRAYGNPAATLQLGELTIDTAAKQVWRAGSPVELTAREYAILELLTRSRGTVVARARICEHIYNEDTDVLSNVVDVHVAALRRKLGADLIRTRRGEGYIIDA
ncbi:MAG TPA: response regulator transcription factor, partial [Candidatus Limnocylindria bacterium]|nr:response regulator transcription factor [Candidatus Limnocylindria bacterium]